MKTLPLISFFSLLFSCNLTDSKFVRRKIDNSDIVVTWYFYSYITSVSPDIVVVEKDNNIKEIYRAKDVVADVTIKEKSIILKLVKPWESVVLPVEVLDEIFGYKIILDTSGTYQELYLIPDGVKM